VSERWQEVGSFIPPALSDTALELHWAVQLVAAAGQTFVEPRPDDSHRAMRWDDRLRAFVGAEFAGAYPFRTAIRPADLTLVLLDATDQTLGAFPLAGHTAADARTWLGAGLATYLGGLPPAIETPEYDMPGSGGPFEAGHDAERSAVSALYATASEILDEVAKRRPDASPVTCWPHHFDIATLLTLERDPSDVGKRTIGVGMAPMGGGYSSWYWYVTPWPYPGADALAPIPEPGGWHTEGWTGAVLTGNALSASPIEERGTVVRSFLDEAIGASRRALGFESN
jgi:hypothetical protein